MYNQAKYQIRTLAAMGEIFTLPEFEAPDLTNRVSDDVADLIYQHILLLQNKQRSIEPQEAWQQQQKEQVMGYSQADADDFVHVLNGDVCHSRQWYDYQSYIDFNSVFSHPQVKLVNVARFHSEPSGQLDFPADLDRGPLNLWRQLNKSGLTDLRQLDAVGKHLGWCDDNITIQLLYPKWDVNFLLQDLPPEGIWPYFVEHIEALAAHLQSFERAQSYFGPDIDRIFDVLILFPRLPEKMVMPILHLALCAVKTYHNRARKLLINEPDIVSKIINALQSTSQIMRINAAQWLAKIKDVSAVDGIKVALKKEKREAVSAIMLSTLEALGEDICALLSPEILLGEATSGLKKKMPKSLEWFPFDALAPLKFASGEIVEADIPKWWIILACKLKDPGGNELFLKYLQLLDTDSRSNLGLYVLNAFISQDTVRPSLEDADVEAQSSAPLRYQSWQNYAKQFADQEDGEAYANKTLEDAVTEIRNEQLATYLGSAIKDKGILSLITYVQGSELVAIIRNYMKNHHSRRAQIESILKAIAPSNDALIIQLLLSLSRRYRTRSVQDLSLELVERIATRNSWTQDELADRTLPSAGFDGDGRLTLDFGSRQFMVSIDPQFNPMLTNEAGKVIKALPQPRQSDSNELVKEAKSLFSSAKKELKLVITLSTDRFYEAMCASRLWPASDWLDYIQAHPLANRMAQRLIWQFIEDDNTVLFRPTEEGALVNIDDDDIELPTGCQVQMTHRSLLNEATAKAWFSHLNDYGVKPLFEQLSRPQVERQFADGQTKLNTYQGYVSGTFTLRGAFTKLGYKRGTPRDGGGFSTYEKDFNSFGLKAYIVFSGSYVPEENITAALDCLCFGHLSKGDDWFDGSSLLLLKDIPPILVSETLADFKAVADKTGGFRADWEKLVPW
jgi:hypothetical protein